MFKDKFESDREFIDYLKDKSEEIVGVRDLKRANKRYDMLIEWRQEKDVCN